MTTDTVAVSQLFQAKGIGPRTVSRLFDQLEREGFSLAEFVDMDVDEHIQRFGLKKGQAESIRDNKKKALELAGLLEATHVDVIRRGNQLYPKRLLEILEDYAPPVLFVAGLCELLQRRGVGFCGARNASHESLQSAEQASHVLAKLGLVVVSGNAHGVDEVAHKAALEAGGETALILPEGILNFKPRPGLTPLLNEENVVVASEFPPQSPWSVGNAMQRNRTICGLVHAMIVIEAGTSGGTWEAGNAALELGVPLFVLDFPTPTPTGKGNPQLLEKGGIALPCRPSEEPDLTAVLNTLEIQRKDVRPLQRMLFE